MIRCGYQDSKDSQIHSQPAEVRQADKEQPTLAKVKMMSLSSRVKDARFCIHHAYTSSAVQKTTIREGTEPP